MHPTTATGFIMSPLLLGGLCIALGIPLALGKVRRNSFYGFRIAKTLENEAVWYKVNAFTGKAFMMSGVVTIVAAFGLLGLSAEFALGPVALQLLGAGIAFVPLAVAVIASSVVCYRA